MNQVLFVFARFALPVLLMAGASVAHSESTEKAQQDAGQRCIENSVRLAQTIEEGSDAALNGYFALLPELKAQMIRANADPYRCSLAGTRAAK